MRELRMGTAIIEQFNPVTNNWNKLYEVDSDKFDPEAPITVNKYGGPYRTRIVGVVVEKKAEVEEVVKNNSAFDVDILKNLKATPEHFVPTKTKDKFKELEKSIINKTYFKEKPAKKGD